MGGCIDLYTSRRTKHHRCKYWKRDGSDKDMSELTHEKTPDGVFYAEPVSAWSSQSQDVGNMFMFSRNDITIRTDDAVGIEDDDIVEYDGFLWAASNIQSTAYERQTELTSKTCERTYIRLRR